MAKNKIDLNSRQIQNIFIDGSVLQEDSVGGIGIYNSASKYSMSLRVQDVKHSNEIELIAYEHCLRYIKHNNIKNARIFTDSDFVFRTEADFTPENVKLHWIPRELNATADKLAGLYKTSVKKEKHTLTVVDNEIIHKKTNTVITPMGQFKDTIELVNELKSYSLESRLNLIKRLSKASKNNFKLYGCFKNNKKPANSYNRNIFFKLICLLGEPGKNFSKNFNGEPDFVRELLEELLRKAKN